MTRMALVVALAAFAAAGCGDSTVKESGQPRLADPSKADPRLKGMGAGGQKQTPTPVPAGGTNTQTFRGNTK